MSVRSVHFISSTVLKNLIVFRNFCLAILQYLVKFIFAHCHKQQHFAAFFFCEVGSNLQKKKKEKERKKKKRKKKKSRQNLKLLKLVLKKINSLKVVAQG